MTEPTIELITGGSFTDARGKLQFFNDFDMSPVKRFYRIDHPDETVVRAWQGHQFEQKWFYVIKGSFLVAIVQPEKWDQPSGKEVVQTFTLAASKQQILHIPGGYVNGFKALEPDAAVIIFSNFNTQESEKDNYRFEKNSWFDWSKAYI